MASKFKKQSKSPYYISTKEHKSTKQKQKQKQNNITSREAFLENVDIEDFMKFVINLTTTDIMGGEDEPRHFAQTVGKVNMKGWDSYSDRDFVTYPAEYVLEAGGEIETVWGQPIHPDDVNKFVVITSGLNIFRHMAENAYIARRILPTMHMERIAGFENGCIQTESGGTLTPLTCYELKR